MPVHGGMAAHAPTHEDGGADEIDVTGLSGLLADDQHVLDAEVLAVAAALIHAVRHENGGADEINVAGLNGLLADDQHVLDAEVLLVAAALVHAARHENGGADEISVAGLSGLLADAQNPVAHAALHQNGGADEISVAGLSGLLADDQHVLDAEVLLVAAALVHAGRHQDGGADEISVAGLSGLLADDQHVLDAEVLAVAAALVHAAQHKDGGADELDVSELAGALGSAGEIPESDGAAVTWVDPDGRYTPAAHGAAQHTNVTRELFIPVSNDSDANASIQISFKGNVIHIADNLTAKVPFTFKVPDDFVSYDSIKVIWVSSAVAGNMRWNLESYYGAAGESVNQHTDAPVLGETATGGFSILNVQEPVNPLTLVNLAIGDYVNVEFERDGAHANDTVDDAVKIHGLLFTYTASQ